MADGIGHLNEISAIYATYSQPPPISTPYTIREPARQPPTRPRTALSARVRPVAKTGAGENGSRGPLPPIRGDLKPPNSAVSLTFRLRNGVENGVERTDLERVGGSPACPRHCTIPPREICTLRTQHVQPLSGRFRNPVVSVCMGVRGRGDRGSDLEVVPTRLYIVFVSVSEYFLKMLVLGMLGVVLFDLVGDGSHRIRRWRE